MPHTNSEYNFTNSGFACHPTLHPFARAHLKFRTSCLASDFIFTIFTLLWFVFTGRDIKHFHFPMGWPKINLAGLRFLSDVRRKSKDFSFLHSFLLPIPCTHLDFWPLSSTLCCGLAYLYFCTRIVRIVLEFAWELLFARILRASYCVSLVTAASDHLR